MADFRIVVQIDPSGAVRGGRVVQTQLNQIGNTADRVRNLIVRAFAFAGITAGITGVVQLTDAYTGLQNRLRVLIPSQEGVNATLDDLADIARRTRSPLEAITSLYQRGSLAATELGISNDELLVFVERVGKGLALQGTSAEKASGALLQLGQSLGSGIVRAEEFNAILEGAFPIAQAAARGIDEAGGSVARLRVLIADGQITSEQFFAGFIKGSEGFDEAFGRTVPTVAQAFVVLKDSLTIFLGELDTGLGITRTFAQLILDLSNNLDVLARAFGAAAIVIGTIFAKRAVGAAIVAVRTLTAAIAANPLGALAIAILAVISLLTTFSDQIALSDDGFVTLKDGAIATFQVIGELIQPVIQFIGEGISAAVSFASEALLGLGASFGDVLEISRRVVNAIIGHNVGLARAMAVIFNKLATLVQEVFSGGIIDTVRESFSSVLNFATRALTAVGNVAVRILNAVGLAGGEVAAAVGEVFSGSTSLPIVQKALELGAEVKTAYLSGFEQDFVGDALAVIDPVLQRIAQRAREISDKRRADAARDAEEAARARAGLSQPGQRIVRADPELEKILDLLRKEGELLQLNNQEREIQKEIINIEKALKRDLTATELEQVDALLRQNQAYADQADILDEIRGPMEDYMRGIEALNALLAQQKISQDEYNTSLRDMQIALLDTQTTLGAGFSRGFLKAQRDIEDFAKTADKLITDAFRGAQEVVVDFFKTGKFEAQEFFSTLADNLLRLGTQMLFAQVFGQSGALGGLLGGLAGGGMTPGGVTQGSDSGIGSFLKTGIGLLGSVFSGGIGAQHGADFTVNGNTAAATIRGRSNDRRFIPIFANDGERVTVTPSGQAPGGATYNFSFPNSNAKSFERDLPRIRARTGTVLNRDLQRNT